MTQEERKSMIDKIVALLAKAESTTHDAESALFNDKAGELMAKYSIAFTDIRQDNTPQYTTEDYLSINPSKYDIQLENAIAKFNGVLVIIVAKKHEDTKYIRLVGSRENIENHTYMMDLVKSQRASTYQLFVANKALLEKKVTTSEKNSWYMGYSYGVNNKVWDIINAGRNKQQEWGLIVIDPVTVASDWYSQQHVIVTRKGRESKFSAAGLHSGWSVNLSRGVNYGNGSALMIA